MIFRLIKKPRTNLLVQFTIVGLMVADIVLSLSRGRSCKDSVMKNFFGKFFTLTLIL